MAYGSTGWMARIPALFGQCKRCTRTSMLAAIGAWIVVPLVFFGFKRVEIAAAAALIAVLLTGLWLAHLVALASRGTLRSMLSELGAEPQEVKAIIGALGLTAGAQGRPSGELKEGEAVSVRRVERPGRPGFKLTRVVVTDERGVIAAASLSGDGAYERLDPKSVE